MSRASKCLLALALFIVGIAYISSNPHNPISNAERSIVNGAPVSASIPKSPPPVFGYKPADEQPELAFKPEEGTEFTDMPAAPWRVEIVAEQPVIVAGPCGDWSSIARATYDCNRSGTLTVTDSRTVPAGLIASAIGAAAHNASAANRMYFPNRVQLRFSYWQCISACPSR